ncbi:MAG: M3 family oligoendopeptidase [Candidatus Latescibacteria bacterium]|nr:M3 family oligoendopeptidase [Candidatus Latescibacterota bacterium]
MHNVTLYTVHAGDNLPFRQPVLAHLHRSLDLTAESLPTWDLTDLYAAVDDPQLEADMTASRQQAVDFETKYKGTIAVDDLSATHLLQALLDYESLLAAEYPPQSYAQLHYSTATTDAARGALLQKTRESGSDIATHLVFFDLEIGQIPQGVFDSIVTEPALSPYHHYLEHERVMAAHNLSEPEERILVETSNSRGRAFARLATEVNSRTRFTIELDGRTHEKTQSEILVLLYDADRELRRKAAASISAGLQSNSHVCTYIYNTLLHEKDVLDRLRTYDEPEASRHLANELDGAIVDTVSDVCATNFDTVARYYRLKGRILGIDDLAHYDRYAPMRGQESDIPFSQARQMVLDSFRDFSPELAETADRFFANQWIDAALGEGKRGGAYCAAVTPDHHPYVFMNYTGNPRDVMTLAHELGHGIHDVLASDNHLLDYHPVLPMAETASTFGEMLVFDRLLGELTDDGEKLALVCSKVEDTFATVFRQIAMYRFEQQAHKARRAEGELPTERFSQMWQDNQQAMFGDSLTLGEEHADWWLHIPHIVDVPFYVYAYAFGELLVLALYAKYQQEGASFVERYFQLLSAGGSKAPADLVGELGLDIADRNFWQGGCDLIAERVAQAEQLAASTGAV